MNENRYRNLFGAFGAFSVMNGTGYYATDRCLIKVYVPLAEPVLEQMVLDKLYQFQKSRYMPISGTTWFAVRAKETRHPVTKTKMVEFASEVEVAPGEVLEWLKQYTTDIPLEAESLEMGKEGWSVGPCIIRKTPQGNKSWGPKVGRYVRVRFNKLSIPFYLSEDNMVWLKDITTEHINDDRHLKALAPSILEFFTKNQVEILSRAKNRPFNKSGVSEYDPPDVSFFQKIGSKYELMFHQGNSNTIDKSKLASPDYEPMVTLRYRGQYGDPSYRAVIVAAVGEDLFEVKKFTADRDYHGWNSKGTSFLQKDLVPLDPEDEYVRERAIRALKSKL